MTNGTQMKHLNMVKVKFSNERCYGSANWGCERTVCKERNTEMEGSQLFVTSQDSRRVGILNHMLFPNPNSVYVIENLFKYVSKFMYKFMAYPRENIQWIDQSYYFCSD